MNAIIVGGLGWGDEGKGSVVDAVVRKTGARLVVRYNGGAQAAHHVVAMRSNSLIDHCHAQTGAGTVAGADTYLSRFVLVDPVTLGNEVVALRRRGVMPTVFVDPDAPVITVWHRALNRLRELSRKNRHGSCGMGIGELASDLAAGLPVIRMKDLADVRLVDEVRCLKSVQAAKLWQHVPGTRDSAGLWRLMETKATTWMDYAQVRNGSMVDPDTHEPYYRLTTWTQARNLPADGTIVFEGAQGVLLDERHGFYPHTTWSDCTFANARTLCGEANITDVTTIGVLRAFATRHGAGPFPTELDPASIPPEWRMGEHNDSGPWQGAFRYGHFDAVLARYALNAIGGVDRLALTCVDRYPCGEWRGIFKYADRYAEPHHEPDVLKPDHAGDQALLRKEAEGFFLSQATPMYRDHSDVVGGVAAALGRSVDIVSLGPMAADKHFVRDVTVATR